MPTAGRLVAVLMFAPLAWHVSSLIVPLFPNEKDIGRFVEVNTLLTIPIAWMVAGSRAGTGYRSALGYGLTAGAAMVFWCVFLQCFGEMIRLSLRKQYDGPTEAVVGMFELMAKYGQILLDQQVVITLVVGSIVGGFVTEFFGRRYS
jgi:hypothetical protein